MTNFFDYVEEHLTNLSITENGATGYKSTGKILADMLFKVSSYRNSTSLLISDIFNCVNNKEEYLLKFLFYIRDIREGLGERDTFKLSLATLFSSKSNVKNKRELLKSILPYIGEYARYDDLLIFLYTPYEDIVIDYIKSTLKSDWDNYENNKSISLLAKWLPSVNSSSKESKKQAKRIIKALNIDERTYRKTLSTLRNYLKIIETSMCANKWNEINYNSVPSNANRIYKDAFIRHDEARRREYLTKLASGSKEVKMNSSVNFPHDVLHMYINIFGGFKDYDEAVEQLWKNLKDIKAIKDTIVVRDDSGSMFTHISRNSLITAYEVATALAIYCAERLPDAYKNKIISFSDTPKYLEVNQDSLKSKYQYLYEHSEVASTNIEAVFDLILSTAIENNLKQDDLPKNILIISDMEFNDATSEVYGLPLFKTIEAKYKKHGYLLPRLIFWNVCSRTNTIPLIKNELGLLLISGFSSNILNLFNDENFDPISLINNIINLDRYKNIPILEYEERKVEEFLRPDFLK